MILVTDLVAPAAEAAAGVDILGLEGGEEFGEDAFALEGGSGVAVVEAAVVGGDDFVVGAEHFGVEEALDGVFEEVGVVDGFHTGFGDLEHDGPVRTGLGFFGFGGFAGGELERGEELGGSGLVAGGVIGEDCSAVEGAVVFREV